MRVDNGQGQWREVPGLGRSVGVSVAALVACSICGCLEQDPRYSSGDASSADGGSSDPSAAAGDDSDEATSAASSGPAPPGGTTSGAVTATGGSTTGAITSTDTSGTGSGSGTATGSTSTSEGTSTGTSTATSSTGTSSTTGAGTGCNMESFAAKDYLLCTDPLDWNAAQVQCVASGFHLVVVDDPSEDAWLLTTLTVYDPVPQWWLGYSDQRMEGVFEWVDGTPVAYEHWEALEPNDQDMNEDCATINRFPATGEWNDFACATPLPFICER